METKEVDNSTAGHVDPKDIKRLLDELYGDINDPMVNKGGWIFKKKAQTLMKQLHHMNGSMVSQFIETYKNSDNTVHEFIIDTVNFITEGRRAVNIHSWSTIITEPKLVPKPLNSMDRETASKISLFRDVRRCLQLWTRRDQGIVDMVCTIRILYNLQYG